MLNARTLFPPLFRPVDSGGGGGDVRQKIAEIDSEITRIDSQITRIDSVITRLTDASMDDVEVGEAPNGDKLYRRVYSNLENITHGKILQANTDVKEIYSVMGTIRETAGASYPVPYVGVTHNTTVYKGINSDTGNYDLKVYCDSAWNAGDYVYTMDVAVLITKESEV